MLITDYNLQWRYLWKHAVLNIMYVYVYLIPSRVQKYIITDNMWLVRELTGVSKANS